MLGQAHRFHGYGSLRTVYGHGQTVRGPLLSLRYNHNTKRKTYRVAVVVSKKVHKSAVVRNRIRRRLYELIRLAALQDQPAYDVVVSVFSDKVAELPAQQLAQEFNKLLGRTEVPHGIIETKES